MYSTHSLPMLNIAGAAGSETGGWIVTERHVEEEEDGRGVGTDGRNDDWVNVVAHDVGDGRFDGSIGKKAGGLVMLAGDFDSDGAADGD